MPTTVEVRGWWPGPGDGTAARGQVTFTPSVPSQSPADDVLLAKAPTIVRLRADGRIAVDLWATDDPDWAAPGWTWHVTERIFGAPVREYDIEVLVADAAAGLELADRAPVEAGSPVATYALAADLVDHEAATTGVHGIADTAALVLDDDARLTDARQPTAHADTHAAGAVDEVTPAAIGAATDVDLAVEAAARAAADDAAADALADETAARVAADTAHAEAAPAHSAASVSVDPSGLTVVTGADVQTALAELDTGMEPAARASAVALGTPRLLAWDDFDRATGPIGNAPTGQAWEQITPTEFSVANGLAYPSGSSDFEVTAIDVGTPWVDLRLVGRCGAGSRDLGTAVCVVDADNMIYAMTNSSSFRIMKRIAGVNTILTASATYPPDGPADTVHYLGSLEPAVVTMSVRLSGTTIAVTARIRYRDFTATLYAKITDTAETDVLIPATRAGIETRHAQAAVSEFACWDGANLL